ncbi:hypothetical protein D3C71_1762990 [compost metagenome]
MISSSSRWAGRPLLSRARRTVSTKLLRRKCTAEMFTETAPWARPLSSSWRLWRQAVSSTHWLIWMICPVSSATGMNCMGEIMPRSACGQRNSASLPITAPLRASICGW